MVWIRIVLFFFFIFKNCLIFFNLQKDKVVWGCTLVVFISIETVLLRGWGPPADKSCDNYLLFSLACEYLAYESLLWISSWLLNFHLLWYLSFSLFLWEWGFTCLISLYFKANFLIQISRERERHYTKASPGVTLVLPSLRPWLCAWQGVCPTWWTISASSPLVIINII